VAYDPSEENGECRCSHWPASHKEFGKVPIKIATIMEDKEKLVQVRREARENERISDEDVRSLFFLFLFFFISSEID
jgi:hypothetical protein